MAQGVFLKPVPSEVIPEDLVGRRVAVHYNLNRCRRGRVRDGEACFAVRDGGPSGGLAGYVRSFILEDAEFRVRPSGLRRARERGRREVMAHCVGTLRFLDVTVSKDRLEPVAFNPFLDDSFVLLRDRSVPVPSSRVVVGEGRRTWAFVP